MCGRYAIDDGGEAQKILRRANETLPRKDQMGANGDICPGDLAPAMIRGGQVCAMRWGMKSGGGKGKLIINARAETARERAMFSRLTETGRCGLPLSRFYEWRGRDKYSFSAQEGGEFYLAGLYRAEEDEMRFVVLTRPANCDVSPVHPRMPVLLTREMLEGWLAGDPYSGIMAETPRLASSCQQEQLRMDLI